VLFLDEPTLGLDPQTRRHIWDYIKKLNERAVTVLLTTHYMEEADALADRVVIIDRGRIVAEGTPSSLKDSIGGDVIKISCSKPEELKKAMEKCECDITSEKNSIEVKSITYKEPSLEDVFLHYTGKGIQGGGGQREGQVENAHESDEREKMIGDIYAIYLREMRLITTIVMPLLWLGIIGNAFNSAFQSSMKIDFISFLTPGIMVMTMAFTGTISGITTVFDREFGFLKEMLVAPVKRESVLIGKMLGGVTQSIFQGVVILTLGLLMGMKLANSPITAISGMLLTMFLVSMAFVSLGLAVASKMSSMEGFQMVMNFLIQPILSSKNTSFLAEVGS